MTERRIAERIRTVAFKLRSIAEAQGAVVPAIAKHDADTLTAIAADAEAVQSGFNRLDTERKEHQAQVKRLQNRCVRAETALEMAASDLEAACQPECTEAAKAARAVLAQREGEEGS